MTKNFWEEAPVVQAAEPQTEPAAASPASVPNFWDTAPLAQLPENIDTRTGAPAVVREMVGGGPDQDRLATIRKFYPDAQPFGGDNFVFTDPKTGRPTLYNPKGLDLGDFASLSREGFTTAGVGIGATVAGGGSILLAPPTAGGSLAASPWLTMLGGGLGGAGGNALYDFYRWIRGGVDSRGLGERLRDAGVDVGLNALGQGVGQNLPGVVRGLVGSGRNATANAAPAQLADDFARHTVQPSMGQVTGNRALQGFENAAAKTPTGAGRMQEFAAQQLDDVAHAAETVASGYGSGETQAQAGRALQRGAQSFVDEFRQTADALYGVLDDALPANAPVRATNALAALRGQAEEFAAMPNLGARLANPKLRGYLDSIVEDLGGIGGEAGQTLDDIIANGRMPYSALKAFRSQIGRDLADPMAVSDVPRAQLKQIYGALTDDMRAAAAEAGPDALRAFERANSYYAAGLTRIENVIVGILKEGMPERAFDLAMQGARDGGTRLFALRRSLPNEQWDIVSSFVLRDMGMATPGAQNATGTAFSPNTFLTRWNQLSAEAKAALFRGTRHEELVPELDSLVRVLGAMKDTTAMANPSGTAGALTFTGAMVGGGSALGAMLGDGATLGAAGLGMALAPWAAARLLTNPTAVRALTSSLVQQAPQTLSTNVGRMGAATFGQDAMDWATRGLENASRDAPQMRSAPPPQPMPAMRSPSGYSLGGGAQLAAQPLFDDVYVPEPERPAFEPPKPQQVMNWIGSADRNQVVRYVEQRLGANVARELGQAGDNYDAALFALMSDPRYRLRLIGAGD